MIQTTAPKASWLEEHNYNPSFADDWIVGAAHFFKSENENFEVILCSDDTNVRLKAISSGINQIEPPEDLKLPPEPDPLQKENQDLKRELQKLQNLQPKLSLEFVDQENKFVSLLDFDVKFEEIAETENLEETLDNLFESLKKEHKNSFSDNDSNSFTSIVAFNPFTPPSRTYSQLLRDYVYEDYRRYLIQSAFYNYRKPRTGKFDLIIRNRGTSPAKNVEVYLKFPNGIKISRVPLSRPFKPQPPQKPEDGVGSVLPIDLSYITPTPLNKNSASSLKSSPPIEYTGEREIEWGPFDLKHNKYLALHNIRIEFEPFDGDRTGFQIDYIITADNLPIKVEEKLNIRVSKVENSE